MRLALVDIERIGEGFPDQLAVDGHRLALTYRFDPRAEADGISVLVPVAILRQLDGAVFDWLVPGRRLEKTVALLRSLPKRYLSFVGACGAVALVMLIAEFLFASVR